MENLTAYQQVLRAVAGENRNLTVSEVVTRTGLTRETVEGLVAGMIREGVFHSEAHYGITIRGMMLMPPTDILAATLRIAKSKRGPRYV